MIDVKTFIKTPKNEWEAIDMLTKIEQKLLDALFIMQSVVENNGDEFKELHEKKIKAFLAQFETNYDESKEN